MVREASSRLADAAILSSTPSSVTDSGYLLSLLAFELLLKAVALIDGIEPTKEHSYHKLFNSLPSTTRERLSHDLGGNGGNRSGDSLPEFLKAWSQNFVSLRYPYEKYVGLSASEYLARGGDWIAKGAKTAEADFRYYPEELRTLTTALKAEADRWLENNH